MASGPVQFPVGALISEFGESNVAEFGSWSISNHQLTVEYRTDVMEAIRTEAILGLCRLRRGGPCALEAERGESGPGGRLNKDAPTARPALNQCNLNS